MGRILFISDCTPNSTPGYGGGERKLSIYKALCKLCEVDLFLIETPGLRVDAQAGEYVARMLDEGTRPTRWYWRRRLYLLKDFRTDRRVQAEFRAVTGNRKYDAFFGQYHLPFLTGCQDIGPSFIDIDDLRTETWRSRFPLFNQVRDLAYRRALRGYKTIFVTKQSDALKLSHSDVRVLPCISTRPEHTGPIRNEAVPGRMLFVGGMDWAPNREGLSWFIDNCLALVRQHHPQAELRVVGRKGDLVAGAAGVSVAGFVPDILPEYERASIVVCPIRQGTGSIVKLAEAAAYGLPIVTTPFAAKGYEGILEPGRDMVTAATAREFAMACVELLSNAQKRMAIATAVRHTSMGRLDQSAIDNCIREAMSPWL